MFPNPTLLGLFFRKVKTVSNSAPYTIIIPVHNKKSEIDNTLKSVFSQTKPPARVIIVDDCSTDGSTDCLGNYPVDLIRLEKNRGKAGAINFALGLVTDRYIMILDADTILAPDYAEMVLTGFSEGVVGVSGRVLSSDNASECQKSRVVEYLFGQRVLKAFQATIGGMWVLTGCATIWETAWLKTTGGMPCNTLVEDLELTWRAERDHKVNYIHDAKCYTVDPVGFSEYVSQIYRWYSWKPALGFCDFWKLKRGLKAVIAWSIIDTILAAVFTVLLAYSLIVGRVDYLILSVFIDWCIYAVISCYEGAKIGKFWDALEGLPNCMALRYVNIAVLLLAFIRPKKRWY